MHDRDRFRSFANFAKQGIVVTGRSHHEQFFLIRAGIDEIGCETWQREINHRIAFCEGIGQGISHVDSSADFSGRVISDALRNGLSHAAFTASDEYFEGAHIIVRDGSGESDAVKWGKNECNIIFCSGDYLAKIPYNR